MYRSLLSLVLMAFLASFWTAAARAQAVPNAPVTGAISSIAADKTSFSVTVKKAEVVVKVTADTKYTLDDTPSDFAKAIAVGRDVNAILTADGNAFVVLVTNVPVKGTVKSLAADKASFVFTPKAGADVTVKIAVSTKITLDKNPSTAELALAAGNTVTVTMGADGVATDITAKSAKAPKTPTPAPATPAVPATPMP